MGLSPNQNYSNVQSFTPNQFDMSSNEDKFPAPNMNINNISLIKKMSLEGNYNNKFFGSLDIREALLNQDDPIASVRLTNHKLTGFAEESSDEENSQYNARPMIIEENETLGSADINRIQTPNLQPHDLNFTEMVTIN